ncbi:MAG: lytic transglycosylase domain-containing protein [Spirochaetes bacterium]|nr:lytic transglycosylase domain-containing protein [Spirochaetota bacterium]
MLDNMYSVLNRINEIQKRFAPGKNIMSDTESLNTENTNKEKTNFANLLNNQLSDVNKADNNQFTIPEIKEIARDQALKNGISPSLVDAVIKVESGYDPNAVSNKGASGLMQLMPSVLQQLGISNPFSIENNIQGGVSILKHLLQKYDGDLRKALAAYNAGETAVDRNNGVPPYKETKQYIRKVIDAYKQNIDNFK